MTEPFCEKVLRFYSTLKIERKLPRGIQVLNPYANPVTFSLCQQFYRKFYKDTNERTMIIGINPGRFGAGLTGIPFIDPPKLEALCNIPNDFPKKNELSADFVISVIQAYGGLQKFYSQFYINSVSPLGFTFNTKNLNYYDTPALLKAIEPFIIQSLKTQIGFGVNRKVAFCLGEGENFKYLSALNNDHEFFNEVIPLAHPRFIMQYRRKLFAEYIDTYLKKLSVV
jgi:hypothetical protein